MVTIDEAIRTLNETTYLTMVTAEFEKFASDIRIIMEKDTGLCGAIRILEKDGAIIVAENPRPEETVLRLMGDEAAARDFVQERMDTYDRMWDGCGCKINYYQ